MSLNLILILLLSNSFDLNSASTSTPYVRLMEGNFTDELRSIQRCWAFGSYGHFPLTPLFTAVLNSDRYDLYTFKLRYQSFARNPGITETNFPGFTDYINNLSYEDKNYFSVEERAFLMDMESPGLARPGSRLTRTGSRGI